MVIKEKGIKLVATDLDGTLLNPDLELTRTNRSALLACMKAGIHVVIATGRSLTSIPSVVRELPGIRYYVCANGAKVYDMEAERFVYEKYLSEEALRSVWDVITDRDIMVEVFWDGTPYVRDVCMADLKGFGVPDYFVDYIRQSRKPVEDLCDFIETHIRELENINFNYASDAVRDDLLRRLVGNPLYELTSSLPFNLEIGGAGVNKADGIDFVCRQLGIRREETLCIGDNNNDVGMIEYAGIGVAMEDGVTAAKAAADVTTLGCNEDGVAFAIQQILGLDI
jgi:Cof subfamily protein (haloacid dehalogenase superfamily)